MRKQVFPTAPSPNTAHFTLPNIFSSHWSTDCQSYCWRQSLFVANHRRLSLWSDALLLTTADHNLITSSHFWWITNCHFWIYVLQMCLSICRWNHTASEVGRHITETHVRHSSSVLDKGEFSSCSMPWPGTPIKLSIEKHLIDFQKMLPKCEIFNCRFLLPKKKPLYHLSICICIVYTRSGIMCK